jgi:hypothetical protein
MKRHLAPGDAQADLVPSQPVAEMIPENREGKRGCF